MKITILAAMLIALAAASPAMANDQGNANAEQQTQPTPSRGNTSGGPAHDVRPGEAGTVRSGERTGHDGRHSTETAPQNARGR